MMKCDNCDTRFQCYTDKKGFKCTEPYSDETLRKWRDDYPPLERGINMELADRKINKELAEWKINRSLSNDKNN